MDFKFALMDRVKIIELDAKGLVIAIFIDPMGMVYKVRYFHNGEAKEVYFYEFELRKDYTSCAAQ
jgi:hypothetical protein